MVPLSVTSRRTLTLWMLLQDSARSCKTSDHHWSKRCAVSSARWPACSATPSILPQSSLFPLCCRSRLSQYGSSLLPPGTMQYINIRIFVTIYMYICMYGCLHVYISICYPCFPEDAALHSTHCVPEDAALRSGAPADHRPLCLVQGVSSYDIRVG